MKKVSGSHDLGTFSSPGAPLYRGNSIGCQKGWTSERVPTTTSGGGKHIGSGALMSFNSGRTLPSKWEDAERWICSPISGYGISKSSNSLPQKRPKSKSGPIVPPGPSYYSNHFPAIPALEGGSLRNFILGSPFSTGVLAADGVFGGGGTEQFYPSGLSELRIGNLRAEKDEETLVPRAVSQRDMATQMSPKESRRRSSLSPSPPALVSLAEQQSDHSDKALVSLAEQQSDHSDKSEVKDVQVDKRATMIRWSKRRGMGLTKKGSPDVKDFNEIPDQVRTPSFDIAEAAMDISKLQREEAKITAWENLQKAKAEASMRKLEMKLERKRSESMDKIINKLGMAQSKAHKMRSKLSEEEGHQVANTSPKHFSIRKHFRVGSLTRFFICHAF